MNIRLAVIEDIEKIEKLLKQNHVDNMTEAEKKNGFVTTNMSKEQMKNLIEKENGITIAEEEGKIVSFAMAASWDFWSEWPFFANMIKILPDYEFEGTKLTKENSYQYGPICIDKDFRGNGIFEKVFDYSLKSMSDRFKIMATFVNKVNPRSYAAHTKKANMYTAGEFSYNDNNYYLLACSTKK